MIIPTLFRRNEKTGNVEDEYVVSPSHDWEAFELVRGASVRVTTRSGEMVRLESLHRLTPEQRRAGIKTGWYREAGPVSTSARWLWESAGATDLSFVPDGEWEGLAVGERIFDNYHLLEGHEVLLYDLIPWHASLGTTAPIPPRLGRVPLDFNDLKDWMPLEMSRFAPRGHSLWGIVWYSAGVPVATLEARDFLKYNDRKVLEEA
mgnify:CR=1 FL=1